MLCANATFDSEQLDDLLLTLVPVDTASARAAAVNAVNRVHRKECALRQVSAPFHEMRGRLKSPYLC